MKKLLLVIVVFVICSAGLMLFSKPTTPSDKEAGGVTIFSTDAPQPAAALALQPGESAEIEVTPELREYYFGLARTQAWFYLPEFDEGELPVYPIDYWYLLVLDGAIGWDENGYYVIESPWREVDENTLEGYGTPGMPIIAQTDFDEWVRVHFGDVALVHRVDQGKYYDFDGEDYYGCAEGSFPVMYYGLAELRAENVDGRLVYTATLNDYYNAVYTAEWTDGEAARLIIDGQTQDWVVGAQLEVKYYLDEQTSEPFYLQVHCHSLLE